MVDLYYGIDSKVKDNTANQIRSQMNQRLKWMKKTEKLRLSDNYFFWKENREIIEKEDLSPSKLGFHSKMDKKRNKKIDYDRSIVKTDDRSFERFQNYQRKVLNNSTDTFIQMKRDWFEE